MNKRLSEMSLEELWKLFSILLTEHQNDWVQWYEDENTNQKTKLVAQYTKQAKELFKGRYL